MTDSLRTLAECVARLNPDAGEIGPGMLRSLIEQAKYALTPSPAPVDGGEEHPLAISERWWNGDLGTCPACRAQNLYVRNPWGDARHHVECRICEMRGPQAMGAEDAVGLWLALPRSAAPAAPSQGVEPVAWAGKMVKLPDWEALHSERLSPKHLQLAGQALGDYAFGNLSMGYGVTVTVREVGRLIDAAMAATPPAGAVTAQGDGVREALKPFAKAADRIERDYGADVPDHQLQFPEISMGELRRARAALAQPQAAQVTEERS